MRTAQVRFTVKKASLLLVACGLAGVLGCRSSSSVKGTPLAATDMEAMVGFIKHEQCQPGTCDYFACETFSDGQTSGLPSHVVRCRWNDNRVGGGEASNRCAYVHYSVDASNHALRNLNLSSPTSPDGCQADKEFLQQVGTAEKYSGRLP
jgi:hypothetical protein